MAIEFFGNDYTKTTLASMINRERVLHAFLIFGDKGLGKKHLAGELAKEMVSPGTDLPRNINPLAYPDIIWVKHEGVKQTISVKIAREICVDAYVMPNNGTKKVYIFSDCDMIQQQAENALLKLIEEPPPHVYIIFTASAKSIFLDTILSRVISIGVLPCSDEECAVALKARGYADSEIEKAVNSFHGNIGKCLGYLNDDMAKKNVSAAMGIIDSIIEKNEYKLFKSFDYIISNKGTAKSILHMVDEVIRDSCIERYSRANILGCYEEGAVNLSKSISFKRALKLHETLVSAIDEIDTNVYMDIEMASLCGKIINNIV